MDGKARQPWSCGLSMCEPLGTWQHLVTLRAGRESRPRAAAERQRPLTGLRKGQLEWKGCSADSSRGPLPTENEGRKTTLVSGSPAEQHRGEELGRKSSQSRGASEAPCGRATARLRAQPGFVVSDPQVTSLSIAEQTRMGPSGRKSATTGSSETSHRHVRTREQ